MEDQEYRKLYNTCKHSWRRQKNKKKFGSILYQKKITRLWVDAIIIHLDEDKEQDEGLCGRIWGMMGGCRRIFYKVVGEEFGSP